MRPETRFAQANRLAESALSRAVERRERFLEAACAGDPSLRRDVEYLLASASLPTGPLAAAIADPRFREHHVGDRIGPWRLIAPLGRGGMGIVFEAERIGGSTNQRAALKLPAPTFPSTDLERRFRLESQVLARLVHPGIVHLLDTGTTSEGIPYLVMERIDGEPIHRFCDRRRLGLGKRLELFLQVCEAVHFAHANGVVHRDLKPSNILVTAAGEPRLLDFGIAKLLDTGSAETTATAPWNRRFSLRFASPEQLLGEAITPASDLYSLGVVLYGLFTGASPFGSFDRSLEELWQARMSKAPRPLSHALTPAAAYLRRTTVSALRRKIVGDLEAILSKSLRRKPEQRYGSARELAMDLERFLEGRPVSARRRSLGRRVVEVLRRHPRAGTVAGSACVGILCFFLSTQRRNRIVTERTYREITADIPGPAIRRARERDQG